LRGEKEFSRKDNQNIVKEIKNQNEAESSFPIKTLRYGEIDLFNHKKSQYNAELTQSEILQKNVKNFLN